MNKNDFRSLCNAVNVNSLVSLRAVDLPLTEAVVVGVSTGRGRGGSKVLSVKLPNGDEHTYSSAHSNRVLFASTRVNGELVRFGSLDTEVLYGPNQNTTSAQMREVGSNINNLFKTALAKHNLGEEVNFSFEAAEGHILGCGLWQLTSGRLVRGRGGQVALKLTNPASDLCVEVWSRRLVGEVESAKFTTSSGYTESVLCVASHQ